MTPEDDVPSIYFRIDGNDSGPYTAAQFKEMRGNHTIQPNAMIRIGNEGEWRALQNVSPEVVPENTPLKETSSILNSLETLSILVLILWFIIGLVMGGAISEDASGLSVLGIIIGGLLGALIGHFSRVFIDWSRQMLVLQDSIAKNLQKE